MRVVPAANGFAWIITGARLFLRAPFGWIFGVFAYWGIALMSNIIPVVGPIAASVLLPAFSVSFMAMARTAEAGQPVLPPLLFAGFSNNVRSLLLLGAIYVAAIFAILGVSALFDGGALSNWMLRGEAPPSDAEAQVGAGALIVAFMLYVPVLAAFWFAPVLAAWEGMPATKALFYSFFAVLRNWRPFLVYTTGVVLAAMPLMFVFSFAVRILGPMIAGVAGNPAEQLAAGALAASPVLLAAASILLASVYASWRDIFPPQSPATAGILGPPDGNSAPGPGSNQG